MRIALSDTLHGYSLREIRHLLTYMRGETSLPYAGEIAGLTDGRIKWLCDALVRSGHLARGENCRSRGQLYSTTVLGNALAMARATPPVARTKADRTLAEFLDRVRQLEARDDLLYRVTRAVVFGSYLTEAATLGDVDVAIQLASKLPKAERWDREQAVIAEARASGRQFSNIVQEMYYPQYAVRLFLKARSRVLSLHDLEQDAIFTRDGVAVREVWPAG